MDPAATTVDAFFAACRAGDVAALRELLSREPRLASERQSGTTGLHVAVHHPDAVRLLLEHGADPNARQQDDYTPLMAADQHGDERLRDLLVHHGAEQT